MDTRGIVAAMALLLLTACGVPEAEGGSYAATGGGEFSEAVRAPHEEGPPVVDDKPCRQGRKTELAEAKAAVDFAVVIPSHDLASENSVREVWQCPTAVNERRVVHDDGSTESPQRVASRGVILLFDSGVRLYEERSLDDAHADWEASAASNGGIVETVHGRPAWLLAPDPPDGDGGVFFVENDVMVKLIGNGEFSIGTLHEIAESLQP